MPPITLKIRPIFGGGFLFEMPEHSAAVLSSDQLQSLVARTGTLAELASGTNVPDEFHANLKELGNDVFKWALGAWAEKLQDGVYLKPQSAQTEAIWRALDAVGWETARNPETGKLVLQSGRIVRGLGDKAPEPFKFGSRPLKVLLIGCNPNSADLAPLDLDAALNAVKEALQLPSLLPVISELQTLGTLDNLQKLLKQDRDWDLVHIVAHGKRRESRIYLTHANGGPDPYDYQAFAGVLADIAQPRLITLEMCGSTNLALEIALRHRQARVIGWHAEVRQETLGLFCRHLYRELFQLPPVDDRVHVEEAFRQAVCRLRSLDHNEREWFLPVVYGPSDPIALFDVSAERLLVRILDLVRSGNLSQAEASANQLINDQQQPDLVRQRARNYLQGIHSLQAYHKNLTVFEQGLREAAAGGAWHEFHQLWEQRNFAQPAVAGAGAVQVQPVAFPHTLLADVHARLEAVKNLALAAVAHLAKFQQGAMNCLLTGCEELSQYVQRRGKQNPLLHPLPYDAFRQGIRQGLERARKAAQEAAAVPEDARLLSGTGEALRLLAETRRLLDQGPPRFVDERQTADLTAECASIAAQAVGRVLDRGRQVLTTAAAEADEKRRLDGTCRGLRLLIGARTALKEGGPAGLDERARSLSADLEKATAGARQMLEGCRPRRHPPRNLLQPGQRLALLRWLKGTATREAMPAVLTAEGLEDLLHYAEEIQKAPTGIDLTKLPPHAFPLLGNEAAPFVLVRDLDTAFHAYICLAGLDVRPDSPAAYLRDSVEYQAGSKKDSDLRGLLLQATTELTDLRRRLCLDIQFLPCHDTKECTHRFEQMATCVLQGKPVPDHLFEGLAHPLDRAALLAVGGRPGAAVDVAEQYVRDHPGDGEALQAALVVSLHHAALVRDDPDRFAATFRRALSFHGLLAGIPDYLQQWTTRRYAVYQSDMPTDLSDRVEAVAAELASGLERCLGLLDQQGPARRDLAHLLRREAQAEVEGARAAAAARLFRPPGGPRSAAFVGGYLAARGAGQLRVIGDTLLAAYHRLTDFRSQEEYVNWAAYTKITKESFHELVFLFSDLRTAFLDPGGDALPGLRELLPEPADLEVPVTDPTPSLLRLLAAPDFGERCPFHAALPRDERPAVLAAHAALLAARSYLAQARKELGSMTWKRARIVGALDLVILLSQYVEALGYTIGGSLANAPAGIEVLCADWANGLAERYFKEGGAKEGGTHENIRQTLEEASGLAKTLAARYRCPQRLFQAARARLHLGYGCFVANTFRDGTAALEQLRLAHQCDPGRPFILVNYLRAARMRCEEHLDRGSWDEGREVLREVVDLVAGFVEQHRGQYPEVEKELAEKQDTLDQMLAGSRIRPLQQAQRLSPEENP
jgi:hypothetical protein